MVRFTFSGKQKGARKMTNEQLAKIAEILGVSEDSISAMDDDVKKDMQTLLETISIKNDTDKKMLFDEFDRLWQKGSVYIGLAEVAKSTGITIDTLRSLDYETQQSIVYEYMMDSSQMARFYDLTNKALAVVELDKVSKLVGVSLHDLRELPHSVQERVCGAYAMEYDPDSTNTELIDNIREMIAS